MTTLTLEDVRNTKFHMARRAGYEVTDVDIFVDRVEASFAQLVEENEMLRRQVEALQQAAENEAAAQPDPAAFAPEAMQEQPQPFAAPDAQAAGPYEQLIVSTSAEASPAVVRLVQMATEQAEHLVSEAEIDARTTLDNANREATETIDNANRQASETLENANREATETIDNANRQASETLENANREATETLDNANREATETLDNANRQANEITTDAQTRSDRTQSEARFNSERMISDAENRAQALDQETANRRTELFASLDQERDELQRNVAALRQFEAEFRKNFTSQLRSQLDQLENSTLEPVNEPVLAQGDLLTQPRQQQSENRQQPSENRQQPSEQGFGQQDHPWSRGPQQQEEQPVSTPSATPRLDALMRER